MEAQLRSLPGAERSRGRRKRRAPRVSCPPHMAREPSVKCPRVWLLLGLCVRLCQARNSRVSMDDDVLLPYVNGHGPSHSHRHVRDCQSVFHGNTTHETWPSSNHSGLPVAESTSFVTDVPGTSRWVYGHMTVVLDPLRTLSVLEPGGPGGCGMNHRASVEETAEPAACLYAQNAGFFDTKKDKCLGNVVSDGRMVQNSGGVQNAQFGIRKDGGLVFGYLSQDDVLDQSNPFVQLVSGVVWLLRDGEVYINESLKAECDKTQETGNFRTFVDVVSARTAVGHDAEGRLILFQIDGQTRVRGLVNLLHSKYQINMNLWEVADFLKKYGVINAINLDGGGSSTYVIKGSLGSYPSDHCEPDGRWRCGRRVSTILCVHQRRCQPADCSGHGDCVDGRCRCQEGWQGAACDSLLCQPPACGPHGVCTAECLPGFYGDGCNQTCTCVNGGSCSCDPVHGRAIRACPSGFHGNACEQVCPLGFFGPSCSQECRCDDQCPCDPQTGSCNATLQGETNYTLHRAGHCLAKQMFTSWRRDEDARREKPHLTESRNPPSVVENVRRTWLIITFSLASLLSVSLLLHLVRACRGPVAAHFPERRDFSYVPLTDINGAASRSEGSGKGVFGLDDSDSQDEI
ncbi:hypothetical protein L3Q82_012916 [Scortum barcoo]|uniref:Uncharacterized protein n=1 Tax=Scortum barcoo TaxID=214431 RepID=A0ACB8W084_9TELE|nr:hypothetical protein L3Q82_012916 [Scortum barcoo]